MKILLLTYYSVGTVHHALHVFLLFSSFTSSRPFHPPRRSRAYIRFISLPLFTFPSALHLPFGQLFRYETLDKNFHFTTVHHRRAGYGYECLPYDVSGYPRRILSTLLSRVANASRLGARTSRWSFGSGLRSRMACDRRVGCLGSIALGESAARAWSAARDRLRPADLKCK